MKIFLIGMPYSGKSTLGRNLAIELGVPFVDLDHAIEAREGKSIPEIFRQQGEDYFRIVESTLLKEWAASSESFVMGTGGGAPCFYEGIDIINQSGISIFLDVPIEELVSRVRGASDRPLLSAPDQKALTEKLTRLHSDRIAIYNKAAFTIVSPTLPIVLQALKIKR
jgi:shikimate kinase